MTPQLIRTLLILGAIHSALVAVGSVSAFSVPETNGVITIRTPNYQIGITKKNLRYGFAQPDGRVIAPPSSDHGLEFGAGHSVDTKRLYANSQSVTLEVTKWMDYDTGEIHVGPKLLKDFALPVGKTPLFVGGKGVLVLRDRKDDSLHAAVYPIATSSTYRFTHKDGRTRTTITNSNSSWENLTVIDTTGNKPAAFERENKTGAIRFAIIPGRNYELRDRQ